MLSLLPQDDALRVADNLLPDARAGMVARAGLVQAVAGVITAATYAGGAIWYVDGCDLYRLPLDCQGGPVRENVPRLDAQAMQVLTTNAERERRVYFADGMHALWYAAEDSGVWREVVNTVTDDGGGPYPVPVPTAVAVWRNRLWAARGDNRIQHSGNDDPDSWNPLWTLEFQGARADGVRALAAHGKWLLVGLRHSLWAVEGYSEFDWQRLELLPEQGVLGPQALVSDGIDAFFANEAGLWRLGEAQPLSRDLLDPLFEPPDQGTQLALDPSGTWLVAVLHGRVLLWHRTARAFGELLLPDAALPRALVRTDAALGIAGDNGVWMLGGKDRPDVWLDGREAPVSWTYETWPMSPPVPDGRTVLDEVALTLRGGRAATQIGATPRPATYTAISTDGAVSLPLTTTDAQDLAEQRFWDGTLHADAETPIIRELRPALAGGRFAHRLQGEGAMEVLRFTPRYRGVEA